MKVKNKIDITGWALIVWGIAGLFRGVWLPFLFVPVGIGLLLRKNIARRALIYLSYLTIFMAIWGAIAFPVAAIVPAVVGARHGQEPDTKMILIWIGMLVACVAFGYLFFRIQKFLKKEETIAEFSEKPKLNQQ